MKKVLIIAGSDCSGGAGIQADLKTLTSFGVYGMSVITALTAQNTVGVHEVNDISLDFIEKQIQVCLSDIGTDMIKIGMVSKSEIFDVIFDQLKKFNLIGNGNSRIVLDPVMFAKGGYPLLESKAILSLKNFIKKTTPILTPNIPEAELLSGVKIKNKRDMVKAGKKIMEMGLTSLILKGGHLSNEELVDIVFEGNSILELKSVRINTIHTHGTGCTLSSAIAANLAKSFSLVDSVKISQKYVLNGIKTAPHFGKGHGPINHCNNIS